MKNKLFKKIALAMSFITMLGTLPVNAYELDERGMSIESVEYQTSTDEDFTNETSVLAEIGSTYQVTIPKVIVLSGESKSAEYKVSAEGDIAGYETIFVRPDRIVNLYSVNKEMQVGTITQDKTGWTNNTIDVIGNGLITANGITAGRWTGTFNFEIFLNLVLGDVIAPDHEHNPGEAQIENLIQPDCVNTGSYDEVFYCTDCYEELSREFKTIPANGHNPGSVVEENRIEPTCVLNGSYDEVTYCTVCGEELSRTQVKIPFLGHNFENYVCTRCGVNEHDHVCTTPSLENEILPSDTYPGSYERVEYCDICGLEMSRVLTYPDLSTNFAYSGTIKPYTVPYTGLYEVELWGASGGTARTSGNGTLAGAGTYVKSYHYLNKGDILYVAVGGAGQNAARMWDDSSQSSHYVNGGYNGGGSGYVNNGGNYFHVVGGSGGGATSVSRENRLIANTTDTNNLLAVAGGGGGAIIVVATNESWSPYIAYGTGTSSSNGVLGNGTTSNTSDHSRSNGGGGGGYYGGNRGYAGTSKAESYNDYASVTTYGSNSGNGKAKITFISQ